MFSSRFLAQVAVSFVLVLRANAEQHTIKFVNACGNGTPMLMQNGLNILTGDTYTSNGPWSGIAYLQTGLCNVNGEGCTLLETTLINPTCAGCGSSTDISLISPHAYNVEVSFAYYNGCDGQGKTCSNANCVNNAFFTPTDYQAQVACQSNDVDLLVAFCTDAAPLVTGVGTTNTTTGSSSSPAISLPTSSLPTSSLPTSTLPQSSSTPTLGSSAPGSVPPVTVTPSGASAPSTTPTPTQTSTNAIDLGCGGSATPSSAPIPTATPSGPATSAPTSTPISTPTSTPTIPANSAPPSASASPSTIQSCRPRPTSLTPSNSASILPTSATPSASAPAQLRRHRRTNRIRY